MVLRLVWGSLFPTDMGGIGFRKEDDMHDTGRGGGDQLVPGCRRGPQRRSGSGLVFFLAALRRGLYTRVVYAAECDGYVS
jgi:hypothetical protein